VEDRVWGLRVGVAAGAASEKADGSEAIVQATISRLVDSSGETVVTGLASPGEVLVECLTTPSLSAAPAVREVASSVGGLEGEVAGRLVTGAGEEAQHQLLLGATRLGERESGAEAAARRRVHRRRQIPTNTAGYRKLVAWAGSLGTIEGFGIEGAGSYGAGLARHLRGGDHRVVEVHRPNRQARRRNGKSDPVDAEAAARAVLSGEATGTPKSGNDLVEMIRVLRVARSTAKKARTSALNALKSLVITAPVELREQLRDLSATQLVVTAARLRPGREATTAAANKTALQALACRYQALDTEIAELDTALAELTAEASPKLVDTTTTPELTSPQPRSPAASRHRGARRRVHRTRTTKVSASSGW